MSVSGPISILNALNAQTLELNYTQVWITLARISHPTNGEVQLELDRKQTEVETQRKKIEEIKMDVARRN